MGHEDADPGSLLPRYLDREVRSPDGRLLGRVSDVLVDPGSQAGQWLVLRVSGRLRRHRAVPLALSVEVAGRLVVPASRRDVVASPPVRPLSPLRSADERVLRAHWAAH